MGLSDSRVSAVIAVTDMARAKDFYENKLGLVGGQDQPDGGVRYRCGDTELHVYPSQYAGGSGATIAGWTVDDIDAAVDELTAKGVTFEQYDEPLNTDEKGIARMGDFTGAWFKDPDGNILSIGTG
jgi:catechol 2,3-dioxygenase-like lactoylglutathione lyase family enzyme